MKRYKIGFILVFAVIGVIVLRMSLAATSSASIEPEQGTRTGTVSVGTDSAASGGSFVTFNGATSASTYPQKLAIYYGDPGIVNGAAGNLTSAQTTFAAYDLVIFGEGIEQSTSSYHAATQTIMQGISATTTSFGYIDTCVQNPQSSLYRCSNFPQAELASRVDKWKAMGARGIFLDQAGCDYVVSRDRLNTIVDYIHSVGLEAFVNIWNLPEAFEPGSLPSPYSGYADCNPNHLATHLTSNDYVLLESWAVILSDWSENYTADPTSMTRRGNEFVNYKNQYGTKGATVNTIGYSNPPFNQAQFDYTWWSSYVYGIDAMAWGETWVYSSDTNQLPFHTRPAPANAGTSLTPLTVTTNGNTITRPTTTGTITLSIGTHTGSFH